MSCILDVFIYSIAIARLRTLHVQRNKRIQLIVVFTMGFLAVAFSFTNFVFNAVNSKTSEQMWYALWVAIFKVLEANIALICACATFIPAFWKSFSSPLAGSTLRPSNDGIARSDPEKHRPSDEALVGFQKFDSMPELAPIKTAHSD
ncbi:hypothetical protein P171DRAFT_443057 [Karstenula rhodostoma CBS 690.94]|uniref:Rhodopsin domain-containing protein n=1 Tax=Karstenula rhodostoma CBS 690.94 TaxID=1392251 RepID=A0A9P4PJZ2_9PLEO|nr:hypothetical protein P171DRAFT_443057 [Karstenula rhodostoma CBS 690.94]